MAPYISVSERRAASCMTWTLLVAHVRATEQCAEGEARRQIGNAIVDRRLFAWWADKPTIPPMPGSEFSWIRPSSTRSVPSPDDAPPLEATYWLECMVDPTCPDRVLEPPMYDPGLVDAHIAKRLDKRRRFRKPIFRRDHVLHLWPATGRAIDYKREPSHEPRLTKSAFREEVDAQYEERIKSFLNDHHRYPTREEDRAWGKERGLGRIRINELRASFLPENVRKGGRPKTPADAKLGKK
jgi:hypothetical protein